MRMAGRMGGDRTTVHNLEVVAVAPDKHELVVKGAVPGARNGLVIVTSVK
jgi:large subunit ribosomal protein L3